MKKEVDLYETIYLVNPRCTKSDLTEKIEYYQNFLVEQGSQVMVHNRGKRSLSYPIKGFDTANYIQMIFLGNGSVITSLQKAIMRDENILRNITTRLPQGESFA
jgi:ribosomal protein S6